MTTLNIEHNYPYADTFLCACDNCGTVLENTALNAIKDAEQRLTPGEETPAGECPHCYALVFLLTTDAAKEHGIPVEQVPKRASG
jgi:hypothetical protein